MYNYCTLFDSRYLTRGLAMYESLKKHSEDFHLFIFAFNDVCLKILQKLNLDYVTIVSLEEFESEELLKLKAERSSTEYCWTCTPSVIKYCIENYKLKSCTYLDADLYFFTNPVVLIDEMNEKSVLITEHRYTPRYNQSKTSGIYCVQFMTFKNDKNGMIVLEWWRKACNKWCYDRPENGKFGDQKYLDDWPVRFHGIHVLQNSGGGLAPWNIQQYDLKDQNCKPIFYHFHQLKFLKDERVDLGDYTLNKIVIENFYKPYIIHLFEITKNIEKLDPNSDFNGIFDNRISLFREYFTRIKRLLKNSYNVYNLNYLI